MDIFKKTALCIYGENTLNGELAQKVYISVNNNKNLKNFEILSLYGLDEAKNHLTLLSL